MLPYENPAEFNLDDLGVGDMLNDDVVIDAVVVAAFMKRFVQDLSRSMPKEVLILTLGSSVASTESASGMERRERVAGSVALAPLKPKTLSS